MRPPAAVISVGTNSTRALVVEFRPEPAIVFQRSIGTRIGEGLRENGRLQDDAMRRALDAIREYVIAIRKITPNVEMIATSALRRAENADEFAHAAQAIAGTPLETISGDEEARCSYEGAVSGLPPEESYGVLDVGGGSTEYASRDADVSCEIGAVRLSEQFSGLQGRTAADELEPPRTEVRAALRPLQDFERVDRLVVVGGSATTACAVIAGKRSEAAYTQLSRAALSQLIDLLASLPLEKRKELPGMIAQRADILLAGAIILDEACAVAGHAEASVSRNDLLLGYLLRH